MTSPSAFFYFFKILIFQVVTGVIGQKKVFVRNHHVSYDYDFWYTCIKWWYPQYYFNEMIYHWDFWYTCIISWYFWVFFFISLFFYFLFFINPLQQFFNKLLFFSFVNECLKRNSEVCPTFIYVWFFLLKYPIKGCHLLHDLYH